MQEPSAGAARGQEVPLVAQAPHWQVCDGDGPYLLLIHGFLSSRAQWQPNIRALGEVCRPVLLELYGHGRSPVPQESAHYAAQGYAAAIDAIREQLGVQSWFVCGYSLGAAISIRYALSYPTRVRGHVFTNSASAFADSRSSDAWRSDARESAERIRRGGKAALERIAVHPRRAKRLPPALYAALLADADRIDPEGVANAMEYTLPTASVRADLKDNRRPALLVCGRFEKRFAAHRAFAEAVMPALTIADVDSGHAVNMTAAEAFNAAVSAFVLQHR